MIGEILQFILVALVLGGIFLTARTQGRNHGRANPVDTGPLSREISALGGEVGKIKVKLGEIEEDVDRLESEAASKDDIKRVEKTLTALTTKVGAIGEAAASREATLDHVKQQVDRVVDIAMKRGL